jgi:hypothetical protein
VLRKSLSIQSTASLLLLLLPSYLSLPKLPSTPLFDRIPQAGIWGNDHIMMWNTNSDQIAELVLRWIERHIEKKKVKTVW